MREIQRNGDTGDLDPTFLFTRVGNRAIHVGSISTEGEPTFGLRTTDSMDNVIASREVQIERKHFVIEFRENERGRFVRITEEAHGRRNAVIIPSTGLSEFAEAFDDVLDASPKPTDT